MVAQLAQLLAQGVGCVEVARALRKYTLEEIEEYCRDPDSSGCDLDMMDALRASEALSGQPVPASPPRWSAEIDDAVFKTD